MSEIATTRPSIGLLNLMPAPVLPKTEKQWADGFDGLAQIIPVRFDEDPRADGCRSAEFLAGHLAISDVQDDLDGIVVTGANLETQTDGSPMPFDAITYIAQLREVIDWAQDNTKLSVYSCLASHVALNHLFGVERTIQSSKTFGVYCHDVLQKTWLTEQIDQPVRSPHSRWGTVPTALLCDAGVTVSAESFEAGWLLAQVTSGNNETVFLQGHPEYGRDDLAAEYRRDAAAGQPMPENYFPNNDPTQTPRYDWQGSTKQLFHNIAQQLDPVHA